MPHDNKTQQAETTGETPIKKTVRFMRDHLHSSLRSLLCWGNKIVDQLFAVGRDNDVLNVFQYLGGGSASLAAAAYAWATASTSPTHGVLILAAKGGAILLAAWGARSYVIAFHRAIGADKSGSGWARYPLFLVALAGSFTLGSAAWVVGQKFFHAPVAKASHQQPAPVTHHARIWRFEVSVTEHS